MKLIRWNKLNRVCRVCKKDRADVELAFATKITSFQDVLDSPTGAYHFSCLPVELKEILERDEKAWLARVTTPPGA